MIHYEKCRLFYNLFFLCVVVQGLLVEATIPMLEVVPTMCAFPAFLSTRTTDLVHTNRTCMGQSMNTLVSVCRWTYFSKFESVEYQDCAWSLFPSHFEFTLVKPVLHIVILVKQYRYLEYTVSTVSQNSWISNIYKGTGIIHN